MRRYRFAALITVAAASMANIVHEAFLHDFQLRSADVAFWIPILFAQGMLFALPVPALVGVPFVSFGAGDSRTQFKIGAAANECMATTLTETARSSAVAFGNAQWNTRWLAVGLFVLLLWRSSSSIVREWLSPFPLWLFFIVTGLAPQSFLLFFPILTRNRNCRPALGVPASTRFRIEFGIALLVTIGTLVVFGAVNYVVSRLSPGTSLASDFATNLAKSPNPAFVYFLLLFSFTFAPVAEEVFFRGFVHNAFRTRMPLLVAGLAQSLIFGFSHFFGVTHACVAFVIGLFLTAVYEWRKTLITPILVHAGINLTVALGAVFMMVAHANSPRMGVNGDPKDSECVIRQIAPNSPAEEAGLQVGDVITTFNSEPIREFPHLVQTVQLYHPGDAVSLTINRSGTVLKVTVVLRRRGDP